MSQFTIVGKEFSPSAFADYAAHVPLDLWKPSLVVLHNTAVPTLAQRPEGLTSAHIEDLHFYDEFQAPKKNGRGWSGGPHLFIDQDGVWTFNPLDRKGVHSPSWNAKGWGVEMLGDFESEPFDSGNGLRVRTNAFAALAALFRRLDVATVTDENLKLHKEDPLTDHDCPGGRVDKAKAIAAVQALLLPTPTGIGLGVPAEIVVYRKGQGQSPSTVLDASLRGGSVYADASELAHAFPPDRHSPEWPPRHLPDAGTRTSCA